MLVTYPVDGEGGVREVVLLEVIEDKEPNCPIEVEVGQ